MISKTDTSTQIVFGGNPLELALGKYNAEVNNVFRLKDQTNELVVDIIFYDSASVDKVLKKLEDVRKTIKKEENRKSKEAKKELKKTKKSTKKVDTPNSEGVG